MNQQSNERTAKPQIFFSGSHVRGHKELSILEKNGPLDSCRKQQNSIINV
ncbi:MAG: hypothetical protein P8M50_04945 [Paracoccaceae bacterium]|nr:hypothetical protein [Paracoccaceae bacterium]